MTLWAQKGDAGAGSIKVQCTYGPVAFSVMEDVSSARHFWGQLGKLIEEIEAGQAAAVSRETSEGA